MTGQDVGGLAAWEDVLCGALTELKVSNGTPVKTLATAILRYQDEARRVVLVCIGAQALSQAVKAVVVANGEAAPQGKILVISPSFDTRNVVDKVTGRDMEITALRLVVGKLPIVI